MKKWQYIVFMILFVASIRLVGLIAVIPMLGIAWGLDRLLKVEKKEENK